MLEKKEKEKEKKPLGKWKKAEKFDEKEAVVTKSTANFKGTMRSRVVHLTPPEEIKFIVNAMHSLGITRFHFFFVLCCPL